MHRLPSEAPLTPDSNVRCPITDSPNIQPLLTIEQIPVWCNVLWRTREKALTAPTGDIRLTFSPTSGHLFNAAFDPARLAYTPAYENSLHFSPHFQHFAEELAQHLVEKYDLHGKNIIEIGSGKGDFLHLLCAYGDNHGLGFDPSYDPDQDPAADDPRVDFIQDYYSDQYADIQADLICCRHVLEHVEQPRALVETVRRSLDNHPETVVYFEMPDGAYTLREVSIWDLIYEHYSHFTAQSLARLFVEAGFSVNDIHSAFGGQFLSLEARPAAGEVPTLQESWSHLDTLRAYAAAFPIRYHEKIRGWQHRLDELYKRGQRVVIWGTGSKGVMFLNMLDTHGIIPYAVDINPRKQGNYVAGSGQRIIAPRDLGEYRPDVVVIMNPLYRDEIYDTLASAGLSPALLVA